MAVAQAKEANAAPPAGKRVKVSSPLYGDIVEFLLVEAMLLDDDFHQEWLKCFADDIRYLMPVRKTLYRRDGKGFEGASYHFRDDISTLQLRVRRSVEIPSAYDRDPAPRIRRLISNVLVYETDTAGEYFVTSYIVLYRNRFDNPQYDILTGKREDLIRRTDDGFKIAKRTILLDQAALGASYMNVFM